MRKPRNSMKELRAWLIIGALQLAWILPCTYDWSHKEAKADEWIEETEDVIRWRIDDTEDVYIEELEVEAVSEPQVTFYNVPLSEDLQMYIFSECEKHNIAPSIVIAMIEMESDFDTYEVSPHGAKGLMQVMTKWHQGRMDRLGCSDLFNPYENVMVGIDYLAELKAKNDDLYWVLMAYNMGESKATQRFSNEDYSEYALGIVSRAIELENEVE